MTTQMTTSVGPVQPEMIDEAVHVLKKGGVIAYPTETVYGLGCDAFCETAVQRVFGLKGKKTGEPMLVLIGRIEELASLVVSVPPVGRFLMERFWPGPLTLVFHASERVPRALTGGKDTIGCRISPDPVCAALLERFQRPLVSTSANPAGRPPAQSASGVSAFFPDRLDFILDGGKRSLGTPSTVVSVVESAPRLLREGALSKGMINDALRGRYEPISF